MRTAEPNGDVQAIDAMYAEGLLSFQAGDLDAVLTHLGSRATRHWKGP